ncbi:MAG: ABC transporter substrate-binding protein [Oligoflexales bacterium]|nr:ABC transporter substrate-binding protein [Oligoflexales bacterium]
MATGEADVTIGTPMYWPKIRAFHFFSNIPFGLNAIEVSSWLRFGGGQELWDEAYASYDCKPFLTGSTGVQKGGWFNKKINDINDFKNLKMRISGLGKEVLKRAGAETVLLPLSEVPKSLSSGKLEAAEFIVPVDDLRIEMFKSAKYYYWPGWHEPSSIVDSTINKKVWESLPSDLKVVVQQTSSDAFLFMLGNYFHKNSQGLVSLVKEHNVKLEHFPSKVLGRLAKLTKEELLDIASDSKLSKRIYDSYTNFRSMAVGWSQIGEEGFSSARSKVSTF